MTVGFISARGWFHSLASGIVRDFQVDLVSAVIGALDHSTVGSIVGSVMSAPGCKLYLFLVLP